MGSRYLTDLADVCRRTGYGVIEVDDWQHRARGSGGYDSGRPNHVIVHHTASGPGSDGWPDVNYCTFGDDDAPLCNLYLDRAGTIFVCAGGATNTNGSGQDPCGITSDDSMNSSAVGIEAGNDGVGEPWPEAQQDSYVALCAQLGAAYGIAPAQAHNHREWAPERKVDTAGPSRWASSGSWDMDAFRNEVAGGGPMAPPPQPEPTPPPEQPQPAPPATGGEVDMAMMPTIKKGDSGPYVARMQHLLAAAGEMDEANTSNYDGVWGNGTDGAKSRFDSNHGLGGSDTSCGPKSWDSLLTGKVW